jgi:hypothetical protein
LLLGLATQQNRVCTNGVLSGSFTYGSCTETGQPCTGTGPLSWVSLNDTQTTTAYQATTEAARGSATCTQTGTLGSSSGVGNGPFAGGTGNACH